MTTHHDTAPDATATDDAAHRLTWRDRQRLSWWFLRFELAMQDYPGREARRIRRELRASVLDDASRIGLDAALRDLGSPRRLAAGYFAELEHERPRWTDGAVLAAVVGVALPLYSWLGWQMGALDAVDAMGGGTVELNWFGSPVTLTRTAEQISMTTSVTWGPLALSAALALVAFALGARVWRLRRG
ncbi:hypothetical protein [Cellulomonas iranensis]|uniref:hypothetical protein n=1 Tax=Cellulomonas iranensis TaxID=76862 RepID=UPI000B3C00FD|nr:hypothetical protein [Cellulomonas iranensis]